MLRYDGPIELAISRYTTEEITMDDVTIPDGGEVLFLRGPAALPVRFTPRGSGR
jgi:cytochrome P450